MNDIRRGLDDINLELSNDFVACYAIPIVNENVDVRIAIRDAYEKLLVPLSEEVKLR